ncbi:hypothetical protein [Arthrobacter bambusae]|nr:hypothetical protein [Arthrobacter bambusae]MDQ0029878.1 hypothetical protein [Arthrobacter bambusae]MDQ0097604.1 hypothetical protein [Arthrobacter bambusae]
MDKAIAASMNMTASSHHPVEAEASRLAWGPLGEDAPLSLGMRMKGVTQ